MFVYVNILWFFIFFISNITHTRKLKHLWTKTFWVWLHWDYTSVLFSRTDFISYKIWHILFVVLLHFFVVYFCLFCTELHRHNIRRHRKAKSDSSSLHPILLMNNVIFCPVDIFVLLRVVRDTQIISIISGAWSDCILFLISEEKEKASLFLRLLFFQMKVHL